MEERDFSEIVEGKKELIDQSFRDSVATIDKQGRRNYIFPKKPKGKFYNLRTLTSIVYLVVFFTLPFIKVDGEPLFLFLSLIHISEPTRQAEISYAVFCLKKK